MVSCGNRLPMFWNNVSGSSSRVQSPGALKTGPIHCPEMLVNNYHMTPGNIPEEHRSHQHHGGSLKLRLPKSLLNN
jgi:hypothetical protein